MSEVTSIELKSLMARVPSVERVMTSAGMAPLVAQYGRTQALAAWYERLAELVGRPHEPTVAAPQVPSFAPADGLDALSCSHYSIWLLEHLDHLCEHLGELVRPAERVAENRRKPWWR